MDSNIALKRIVGECRLFHVFDKPCDKGESPMETRPDDIAHFHTQDGEWEVAKRLLPLFDVHGELDQRTAFVSGFLFKNTRTMRTMDWSYVVEVMNVFDNNN